MTRKTFNYLKHTSGNPIQRFLLNNFKNSLFGLVKSRKPKRILDAGCGEGFILLDLMRNKIGQFHEGVDNSADAIQLGKKMYPDLPIKLGDIYSLKYPDNSIDMLVCTEVLEHLDDPRRALAELRRVTGKYLAISVPNEPFFVMANFMRGQYLAHFGNHPEHINHWSLPGFRKFLQENGFKVLVTRAPFPWTLILAKK